MSASSHSASSALRGFLYQFLHSLMVLMDSVPDASVIAEGLEEGSPEAVLRVEGFQDLDKMALGILKLFQLKDVASLSPSEFGSDVLKLFATQFGAHRSANPEFELVTSADLTSAFYAPFRGLCSKLRQTRQSGTPLDDNLLSKMDGDAGLAVGVDKAGIWADARDGDGKPIQRGTPSALCPTDFIDWLFGCLFVTEAGIAERYALMDFLSRVNISDGQAHPAMRARVLERLEGRLPSTEASLRLDIAVGRLLQMATKSPTWQSARVLLAQLRIPPVAVSWVALRDGTAGAARAGDPGEGDTVEERRDALLHLQVWSNQRSKPLFVLSSQGSTGKSWLLRRWLPVAAERAPTVLVRAHSNDSDIVQDLLSAMGWESGDTGGWGLRTLLEKLQTCIDRPSEQPTLLLAVDDVTGTHENALNRLVDLAVSHSAIVVISIKESWLASFDQSTLRDWSSSVWRSSSPRLSVSDPFQLPVSYDLPPIPALSLDSIVASVASDCRMRPDSISASLSQIIALAYREESWTGRVPQSLLQQCDHWRWESSARNELPQALIHHGLFHLESSDHDLALIVRQHPAIAELIASQIGRMEYHVQVTFSDRLARTPDLGPTVPLLDGFATWLSGPAQGMAPEAVAEILRPWIVEVPPWNWTSYVVSALGERVNAPIRLLVDELVQGVPDDPLGRSRQAHTVRRLLDYLRTGAPGLSLWLQTWLDESNDWLKRQVLSFMADAGIPSSVASILEELTSAPAAPDSADGLSDAQRQLALSLARYGPSAVGEILNHLDPDRDDAAPLILALGEIGSRKAVLTLENLCDQFAANSRIGTLARRALALCDSGETARWAAAALAEDAPDVTALGFWMVKHGGCDGLHAEVGRAALREAKQGRLQGTDFLAAALVSRCSATEQSWHGLHQACRQLLLGEHQVWLYRHMIESGLPQALALLLDLVSRVWHEYGHEVNATLYAIWAIAEEKVTSEQLLAAENWLLQDDHRQAISEALLGLAAEDRMGSAWKVAVALKLPCTEAVLRVALGRAGTQYDAARSLSMVPCPEVGSDLAPYAADQQNAAMCMRSAEALAAQQDRAAFWVLVGALREWDVLYRDIGFAFAESAWALDLVSECASWLTDAGEAKCLRQGAALAVGLALREVHGESRTPLVAALADAIAGDSDVANAAAIAARISGAAELFEPLKERVNLTESTAFEAIHAVAAIATSDAVGYLYQLWSDQDLYFMEAAPTTALATAIAQDFIDPASRHGEAWEKAKAWVTTAYERFRTTRGTRGETTPDGKKQYNHLSSDLAIGSALIQLVTAWDLDELTQAIAEETVGDQHGSWYSSFDQHRRWVFLARKSPRQLLEIMGCAEVRELSESNKLHLAEALLAIEDPNLGDGVRQRIVEMSIALKSDPRRKMAALIARREPDWIADVELTDDTVLLLRDIAVNVSPLTSSGILGRLTESDRRRFRTEGQRALWRRDAATQDLVNSLKQDPDPFRRLWWVTGFASVATDALIGDVSEGMEASKDQFQNSAIGYAIEAAEKRLKTDAGREDFRRRSGEEWVW